MPSQLARQLMIENLQDSLRLVRHLMNFELEEFAAALGVPAQDVNSLEAKKIKMTPTQYVAIAALAETYFAQNHARLEELKDTLDGEGKITARITKRLSAIIRCSSAGLKISWTSRPPRICRKIIFGIWRGITKFSLTLKLLTPRARKLLRRI